jgi:hypothetical protein
MECERCHGWKLQQGADLVCVNCGARQITEDRMYVEVLADLPVGMGPSRYPSIRVEARRYLSGRSGD